MFWAFCFFLKRSFTACRRAISGERIYLHRIGFPAILTRRAAGDVGYKQQTSIKDVEHDKDVQLMLVRIEASGCLYPDMRNGAYEKCNDYGSYILHEFCKIEVRHTLKRKNCFLIFSFQTVSYCVISN